MEHLLALALSFPSVVYTVLLGISLIYWVFVIVGAIHLDGAEGGADAALEGAAKGAIDGAVKGAIEGAAEGADGGHVDVDGESGFLGAMAAALKLRSAPATAVLSLLVFFSWALSMAAMLTIESWFAGGALTLAKVVLFVLAPLVALLPTSLAVRPLARIFVPPKAVARQDLVGKLCTIRTGTVTDRFGEATVEDGGAGLVVRVRVDTGQPIKRGQQAVIVDYDEDRQEFTVAPMEDVLDDVARRSR